MNSRPVILPQALLSSGPWSGQFEVDLVYPIRGDGSVEPIENRQRSPRRDLLGQFGVGDQALDRGRQRHGLGWRDEQPVLAIDDRLDDSAGSGRDYRPTRRHSLDDRQSLTLDPAVGADLAGSDDDVSRPLRVLSSANDRGWDIREARVSTPTVCTISSTPFSSTTRPTKTSSGPDPGGR